MRIITFIISSLTFVACIGVPEGEEAVEKGVATSEKFRDSEIDVGFGIKRPMRVHFGSACVEWEVRDIPKSDDTFMFCTKRQTDDSERVSAKIYKDTADRDADRVFPAARACGMVCLAEEEFIPNAKKPWQTSTRCIEEDYRCGGQTYKGCGVAAAANVLNFYGVQLHTGEVAGYIDSFGVPFSDNIASTPDALATGLQRLLNERADGQFTVRRKSYTDVRSEVWAALYRGQPIILLVNNGGHYVTVTGYESWSKMSVTDYVGSERKVEDWDLDIGDVTGDVLGWAGGYLPYTVITIERRPR